MEHRETSRLIHETLLEAGLPPKLLGYSYIAYSMELAFEDPEALRYITKGLYVDVASKYKSTPYRVERAIRHAISVVWTNGNTELLLHIFKGCSKNTPTNSLFLSTFYNYLTIRQ